MATSNSWLQATHLINVAIYEDSFFESLGTEAYSYPKFEIYLWFQKMFDKSVFMTLRLWNLAQIIWAWSGLTLSSAGK